jgi:3-oxo-5-alpha-steroid 4-dehydrogenase 1
MTPEFFTSAFHIYLYVMIGLAAVVFVALYFVTAGYGAFTSSKWGKAINNKLAWFLMEFPIFIAMIILWLASPHRFSLVPMIFLLIFEIHYFQRSLIFPWIMKGKKSKMSLAVMFMGIAFNILNAMMQGYWIFFESFKCNYHVLGLSYTDTAWLWSPQFIIGVIIFFGGFYINLRSDYIIRHLRKSDDDTNHYLPSGFMFNYVTSANYLGELLEWLGFAILTWSLSGLVFFIWTFANLVPRANSIYKRYRKEFGSEMEARKLKRIFPFIY